MKNLWNYFNVNYCKSWQTYVDSKLSQKATPGYVDQQISDQIALVVGSAPQALDTLKELASALGNDTKYASTGQNQLSYKADKATTYTKIDVDDMMIDKADNTSLNLKADKSNVYIKFEMMYY